MFSSQVTGTKPLQVQEEVLGDESFVKPWMIDAADAHYILDISRAQTLLDWSPRRSLRETLPKIVEKLKSDPVGWYKSNKLNPAVVAWEENAATKEGDSANSDGVVKASAEGEHHHHQGNQHHQHDNDNGDPLAGCDLMALMDRDEQRANWAHYATMGLGLWLATSPFVFGIADANSAPDAVQAVTAGRGLPSIEWRSTALAISDVVIRKRSMSRSQPSATRRHAFWPVQRRGG